MIHSPDRTPRPSASRRFALPAAWTLLAMVACTACRPLPTRPALDAPHGSAASAGYPVRQVAHLEAVPGQAANAAPASGEQRGLPPAPPRHPAPVTQSAPVNQPATATSPATAQLPAAGPLRATHSPRVARVPLDRPLPRAVPQASQAIVGAPQVTLAGRGRLGHGRGHGSLNNTACPPAANCQPCETGNCGPPLQRPPGVHPFAGQEYLCDGGDIRDPTFVRQDWRIDGLDQTDTIGHFDTLDGQRKSVPSNRVCIYSPRFAAVRKISDTVVFDQSQQLAGVSQPVAPLSQEERLLATTVVQPEQPLGSTAAEAANALLDRKRGVGVDNVLPPVAVLNQLPPYENLRVVRDGMLLNSEKPRLSQSILAALAWQSNQGVEAIVDGVPAVEASEAEGAGEVLRYELPPGKPRLRVIKLASRSSAKPGDIVDFTLRFDNLGDQVLGNVTLVDNLTNRLEYVDNSSQCSLKHEFSFTRNDGGSLVLRWEIQDPIKVGEGGVIRFKCRVR